VTYDVSVAGTEKLGTVAGTGKFGMGRLIDLELCTEEDLFDGVTVVLGKYSHHGIGAW
jgi:hypothetical protein